MTSVKNIWHQAACLYLSSDDLTVAMTLILMLHVVIILILTLSSRL